eukprot:TRINITY_DN3557_c0_g1_i1.p1 TRINITY_DN3557_c0_g1~~TRINITY_DN3557_c0_g1_i1.p1  ORF type:complete len:744 (+),score=206.38 TRINITY_DN3557_c0_g1_i1:62-2293(+)
MDPPRKRQRTAAHGGTATPARSALDPLPPNPAAQQARSNPFTHLRMSQCKRRPPSVEVPAAIPSDAEAGAEQAGAAPRVPPRVGNRPCSTSKRTPRRRSPADDRQCPASSKLQRTPRRRSPAADAAGSPGNAQKVGAAAELTRLQQEVEALRAEVAQLRSRPLSFFRGAPPAETASPSLWRLCAMPLADRPAAYLIEDCGGDAAPADAAERDRVPDELVARVNGVLAAANASESALGRGTYYTAAVWRETWAAREMLWSSPGWRAPDVASSPPAAREKVDGCGDIVASSRPAAREGADSDDDVVDASCWPQWQRQPSAGPTHLEPAHDTEPGGAALSPAAERPQPCTPQAAACRSPLSKRSPPPSEPRSANSQDVDGPSPAKRLLLTPQSAERLAVGCPSPASKRSQPQVCSPVRDDGCAKKLDRTDDDDALFSDDEAQQRPGTPERPSAGPHDADGLAFPSPDPPLWERVLTSPLLHRPPSCGRSSSLAAAVAALVGSPAPPPSPAPSSDLAAAVAAALRTPPSRRRKASPVPSLKRPPAAASPQPPASPYWPAAAPRAGTPCRRRSPSQPAPAAPPAPALSAGVVPDFAAMGLRELESLCAHFGVKRGSRTFMSGKLRQICVALTAQQERQTGQPSQQADRQLSQQQPDRPAQRRPASQGDPPPPAGAAACSDIFRLITEDPRLSGLHTRILLSEPVDAAELLESVMAAADREGLQITKAAVRQLVEDQGIAVRKGSRRGA